MSHISQACSLEEISQFWDSHDFTDYDTDAPDVEFEVACAVSIEPDLLSSLEEQARLRGLKLETLVNLWLQQKLDEHRRAA